jgi:DNA-binding CsgD family transcriptional regulator
VVSGTALERHWILSGAAAALPKNAGAEALVDAICAGPAAAPGEPDVGGWSSLTHRQREVLRLAAEGLSSREIGLTLGIGSRTVETHRAAAMRRLGVRSFHEVLLRMAWTDERLESDPEPSVDADGGVELVRPEEPPRGRATVV